MVPQHRALSITFVLALIVFGLSACGGGGATSTSTNTSGTASTATGSTSTASTSTATASTSTASTSTATTSTSSTAGTGSTSGTRTFYDGTFQGTADSGADIEGRFLATLDSNGVIRGWAVDQFGLWALNGTRSGSNLTIVASNSGEEVTFEGTLSGDGASGGGSWSESQGSGTWTVTIGQPSPNAYFGVYNGPASLTVTLTGQRVDRTWGGIVNTAGQFWGTVYFANGYTFGGPVQGDGSWSGTMDFLGVTLGMSGTFRTSPAGVSGTLTSEVMTGTWSGSRSYP